MRISLMLATLLFLPRAADAHMPYLSEGQYGSRESAFEVEDPDVSSVLYHPVNCDSLQLWMTFQAEAGYPLVAQLGVPELERLESYRPSLALVGPGLPVQDEELPFEVPEGLGVEVWHSEGSEPKYFFEEFTDTESWIVLDIQAYALPAAGRYDLVAFVPSRQTGKLWLTIGTLEDFTSITEPQEFFDLLAAVDAFHEVEGELPTEEQVCPLPEPQPEAEPSDQDVLEASDAEVVEDSLGVDEQTGSQTTGESTSGCTASPRGPGPMALVLLAFAGLLVFGLRRAQVVRSRS